MSLPPAGPLHFYGTLPSLPPVRLLHLSQSPDSHIHLLTRDSFSHHPVTMYSSPLSVPRLSKSSRAFAFQPPEPESVPACSFDLPPSCSPVDSKPLLFGLAALSCKHLYHHLTIKMSAFGSFSLLPLSHPVTKLSAWKLEISEKMCLFGEQLPYGSRGRFPASVFSDFVT